MAQGPTGLDPTIQAREIAFEADVQSVTPFAVPFIVATLGALGTGKVPSRP